MSNEPNIWAIQREIERRVLQVAVGLVCDGIDVSRYAIQEVLHQCGGYYVGLAKVKMGSRWVRFDGRKHWLRVWISAGQYEHAKTLYEQSTGRCYICRGDGYIVGQRCERCSCTGIAPVRETDPALSIVECVRGSL